MKMKIPTRKIIIFLILLVIINSFIFQIIMLNVGAATKNNPIYSVETEKKEVAITFDMNWGEDYTLEILNILDEFNAKATFFVIGSWINYSEDNMNILKEVKKRGHEIGNHSNTHPDFTKISKEKILKEIYVTEEKLKEVTGEGSHSFRFPSGAYDNKSLEAANSTGLYPIHWSIDSIDWKEQGEALEYNRVVKNLNQGDIILFHTNAKYTPSNIRKLLLYLKEKDYKCVKVMDLIYKDNYIIDMNGKQIHN